MKSFLSVLITFELSLRIVLLGICLLDISILDTDTCLVVLLFSRLFENLLWYVSILCSLPLYAIGPTSSSRIGEFSISSFGLFNHQDLPNFFNLGGLNLIIDLAFLVILSFAILSPSFGNLLVSHAGKPRSSTTPLTVTSIPERSMCVPMGVVDSEGVALNLFTLLA